MASSINNNYFFVTFENLENKKNMPLVNSWVKRVELLPSSPKPLSERKIQTMGELDYDFVSDSDDGDFVDLGAPTLTPQPDTTKWREAPGDIKVGDYVIFGESPKQLLTETIKKFHPAGYQAAIQTAYKVIQITLPPSQN